MVDGNLSAATASHALDLALAQATALFEPVSVPKAAVLAPLIATTARCSPSPRTARELTALTGLPSGTDAGIPGCRRSRASACLSMRPPRAPAAAC
ncbi:hypothetical protein ACU686_26015 [Yinghuangia aomiensis]